MANNISGTSSASDAYSVQTYAAKSNEKNTLSITSYFQLLAAQMQNQDITDPMDNSEMLSSMSQMAMIQALSDMSDSVVSQTAFSTTSFSVGMIGKEVTVKTEDDNGNVSMKTGIVESVNLSGESPQIKLQGSEREYDYASIINVGSGSGTSSSASSASGPQAVMANSAGPSATAENEIVRAGYEDEGEEDEEEIEEEIEDEEYTEDI